MSTISLPPLSGCSTGAGLDDRTRSEFARLIPRAVDGFEVRRLTPQGLSFDLGARVIRQRPLVGVGPQPDPPAARGPDAGAREPSGPGPAVPPEAPSLLKSLVGSSL